MSYIGKEPVSSSNNENRQTVVATAGQTVFNIGYTPGFLDVFVNGAIQSSAVDYTATSGTSFTMTVPLSVGDEVFALARYADAPVNSYSKSDADVLLAGKANLAGDSAQQFSASTINGATISTPNAALNPNFDIAQRGTSFVSAANTAGDLDGWSNGNSTSAVLDVSQGTGHTTGRKSRQVTVTTADTTTVASDTMVDNHKITGYDIVNYDLVGNTFTVAFWAKFPLAGIHGVALTNSGADLSYVHEINVAVANTWNEYQFTVVGGLPTAGTWNYTTGIGVRLMISHSGGSTYQTASVDQWIAGGYRCTANQVNDLATVGNVWAISNMRINKGTQPTSASVSRAEMLARCQERVRNIGNTSLYGQIGNGQCISASSALVEVDVRGMISIPVIENTLTANLFELEVGVSRVTTTSIAINGSATADTNKLNLIINVASGLVTGQVCGLRNNNTATNKIILSSDI